MYVYVYIVCVRLYTRAEQLITKRKRFIHEGRRVLHIYSTDNSAPMERERKREEKERGYEKESERSLLTINT